MFTDKIKRYVVVVMCLISTVPVHAVSFFNEEDSRKSDSLKGEELMQLALVHTETDQGRNDAYFQAYEAYKAFDIAGCKTQKFFALAYAGKRAYYTDIQEQGVLCLILCRDVLEQNKTFRHREMYGIKLTDPYEFLADYYKNISSAQCICNIKKGISKAKEIGDQKMAARLYNQYLIYEIDTKQDEKALEYTEKAIHATSLMKDSVDILISLVNIADALTMMKKCEEADKLLKKAEKLLHFVEGKQWNFWFYEALGHNYLVWKKNSLSKKYLDIALKGFESIDISQGVAVTKARYARLLYRTGKEKEAIQFRNDALDIGVREGLKLISFVIYENIIWGFDDVGQQDSSNYYQLEFYALKDSMMHVENETQAESLLNLMLLQRKHNKSEKETLNNEATLAKKKLENKVLLLVVGGSLGVFLLLIFVNFKKNKNVKELVGRNSQIRGQNQELVTQRDIAKTQEQLIKIAHDEIKSSFEYAKGIQRIILPPISSLKNTFSDAFVWFSPKEIISGDFYWISKQKNKIHVAVSDCKKNGVWSGYD